jgi:hypothetical protein
MKFTIPSNEVETQEQEGEREETIMFATEQPSRMNGAHKEGI